MYFISITADADRAANGVDVSPQVSCFTIWKARMSGGLPYQFVSVVESEQ